MRSLINQLSSTVFKEAERKHSKTDRIRSAFHLIQARNGTFLIESDVISQGEELAFYKESVYNKRVGNISFEIQTNQDIVFQWCEKRSELVDSLWQRANYSGCSADFEVLFFDLPGFSSVIRQSMLEAVPVTPSFRLPLNHVPQADYWSVCLRFLAFRVRHGFILDEYFFWIMQLEGFF